MKIPLKSARGRKIPLVATYITGDFADPSLGGSWRVTLPRAARKIATEETGEEVTQVIIRGRGRDVVGSIPSGAPRQLPTEEAIREAFEGIPLKSVVPGDARVPPFKGGKIALEAEELGDKSMTKNAASAVYQTVEKWSKQVPLGKTAPTDTRLPKGSFDLSREAQAQVDALRDSVEIFGKAFQQDAAQARKVYRDLIESLGSAPHRDIKDYISQKGDVALNEAVGDFLYGKRNTPPAADKLLRWIWDVANQTAQLNAIRGTSGPGHGMEYVKSAFGVLSKRQAQLETLEAANRLSFKARRETTEETWGAAVGRAFMGLPGAAMQSLMPWQARAFLNAGPLRALQSLVGDAAFQQTRTFTEGAGAKTRLKVATNLADQKMRAYSSTEVATSNPTSPTYLSVSEARSLLPVPATVMGIRTAGRRLWDSWDEDPDFSQRYAELSEAVTEVGGSPQGMLLGLSVLTEPLHEADPTGEMGGMYGDSTAQAFSYLAEVMPTGARDPLSGAMVAPAPSECREWLSAADALCDPAAAMGEMVATGLVRQSAVEAVRTCYPELFAQLSMAYAEGAAEAGADYPYAKRMTLWHATGLEIDQTMTDSFLLTASSEFSQTPEQSAAVGQPAAMQAQGFAQAAARMPAQKTMQSLDNMTGLQSLEQKGIG